MELIILSLTGVLGVGLRYLIGPMFWQGIPLGLLLVNTLGCFGIAYVYSSALFSAFSKMLIAIGFMGGLTTFSSYIWISLEMMKAGQWFLAFVLFSLSHLLGFAAAALGLWVNR